MTGINGIQCTVSSKCKANAYIRIMVPAFDIDDKCCMRHVHMILKFIIGLTRDIQIEGVE